MLPIDASKILLFAFSTYVSATELLRGSSSPQSLVLLENGVQSTQFNKRELTNLGIVEDRSFVRARADGSIDTEAWNRVVTEACYNAVSTLKHASNPSGTCVCYNLASLNNATGAFQADLRLFRLTDPYGDFSKVEAQNIKVHVAYNGASAAANINTADTTPQTDAEERLRSKRQLDPSSPQASAQVNPQVLQSYTIMGQINHNRLPDPPTVAQIQALVLPEVSLTAPAVNGETIRTLVSSNEAAFVAGVYSNVVVTSNFALAQKAVDESIAAVKNGSVAFVLPGVNIFIFPIGLIITGIWFIVGAALVGAGTLMRMQYSTIYKRQVQRHEKASQFRI